jgi:hypothetical protein
VVSAKAKRIQSKIRRTFIHVLFNLASCCKIEYGRPAYALYVEQLENVATGAEPRRKYIRDDEAKYAELDARCLLSCLSTLLGDVSYLPIDI